MRPNTWWISRLALTRRTFGIGYRRGQKRDRWTAVSFTPTNSAPAYCHVMLVASVPISQQSQHSQLTVCIPSKSPPHRPSCHEEKGNTGEESRRDQQKQKRHERGGAPAAATPGTCVSASSAALNKYIYIYVYRVEWRGGSCWCKSAL